MTELESRYIALRFGAPTDNQTIKAIENPFNRARAKAYVAYEVERQNIWLAGTLRARGAADGTLERLPKAARTAARKYIADADAQYDAWHRAELRFPAVLRAKGFDDLKPYFESGDYESVVASRIDADSKCAVPPGWSIENARDKFTAAAMNKYRLRFLCLDYGSSSESAEGVPAAERAGFEKHVDYHNEARQKLFEQIVAEFGAPSGFAEDIPMATQSAALLYFAETNDHFANSCRYELELLRIEKREAAAASSPVAMFG